MQVPVTILSAEYISYEAGLTGHHFLKSYV